MSEAPRDPAVELERFQRAMDVLALVPRADVVEMIANAAISLAARTYDTQAMNGQDVLQKLIDEPGMWNDDAVKMVFDRYRETGAAS